ncbi:ABC transporter permease [Phytoactinopolyspora halotolerans]|uniref:ABC transporter permease n=1 Tax=Phytoactinopolyspora halotolerans TaxID=1981512 RepID=A0A6L9S1Y4_9ACTN|nr:ABC transporter permease [Phytoactinopolyspora halotolerans]NED99225.1 ABC transporter permease [Phytoactinopolyspora halotolerans]
MSTATMTPEARTIPAGRGHAFVGTGTMIRFMLRRDRIRIPVWILGLTAYTTGALSSYEQNYPEASDRETIADMADLPAMVAMVGNNYAPDEPYTHGLMFGHVTFLIVGVIFALMGVLLFIRHTRAEEEAGRAELIRSSVLGRHAQTTAALIVVCGTALVAGLLVSMSVGASGVDGVTMGGAYLYGMGLGLIGVVFATVAAVTAQITEYARGASGMALAVLGAAYAVRSVGDVGENFLSWLSPLHWARETRPFSDDQRAWPLLLLVVLAAVLIVVAGRLSDKRDVGAGLRPPRLGSATASPLLSSPLGLAVRLQRSSVIAWAVGLAVFGAFYGALISAADEMFDQISALEDMWAFEGASFADRWIVSFIGMLGVLAAVPAILAVQRLRSEETAGRAEPVLATAVSQTRWAASHLTVALAGSAGVIVIGGFGFGIAAAIDGRDIGYLGDSVAAAAVFIPAIWVAVGLAVALYGLVPRALGLAWIIPVYGFLVVYLGDLFGVDQSAHNLSPFGHVPELPAEDLEIAPLLIMAVIAAVLILAGLAGFRRRDLHST